MTFQFQGHFSDLSLIFWYIHQSNCGSKTPVLWYLFQDNLGKLAPERLNQSGF